jgi:hypothetical protein
LLSLAIGRLLPIRPSRSTLVTLLAQEEISESRLWMSRRHGQRRRQLGAIPRHGSPCGRRWYAVGNPPSGPLGREERKVPHRSLTFPCSSSDRTYPEPQGNPTTQPGRTLRLGEGFRALPAGGSHRSAFILSTCWLVPLSLFFFVLWS